MDLCCAALVSRCVLSVSVLGVLRVGFWVLALASEAVRESHKQTAEQGAAPDRLQLRSLRSCLASVSALPAAGELVVRLFARGASACESFEFALALTAKFSRVSCRPRFRISTLLSRSVCFLQVLVARYLRVFRVSMSAAFRCALRFVRSRGSWARRFLQVLASGVSSLSVPQSVRFFPASTCRRKFCFRLGFVREALVR